MPDWYRCIDWNDQAETEFFRSPGILRWGWSV
jgi:hypothetical protein